MKYPFIIAITLFLLIGSVQIVSADCSTNTPANNSTVTCTVAGGVENATVGSGSQTGVTVNIEPNAGISNGGGLGIFLSSNATINNDGHIDSSGLGIFVSSGTLEVNNSGSINNNTNSGITSNASAIITNNGQINNNGFNGIQLTTTATGSTVINNGEIQGNSNMQVFFANSNPKTLTNNAGALIGGTAGSTAVQMGTGNDSVNLSVQSTVIGIVDGQSGADTLTFFGQAPQAEIDAANAIIAACPATCSGAISFNGRNFEFANFEQFQNLVTAIVLQVQADTAVASAGQSTGSAPASVPGVICDRDGVKVFRLPNGDLEVFSGFDLRPPNGFLVGRVILLDVFASPPILRFSDTGEGAANPGWYVLVSLGNERHLQVFDNFDQPVGSPCRF